MKRSALVVLALLTASCQQQEVKVNNWDHVTYQEAHALWVQGVKECVGMLDKLDHTSVASSGAKLAIATIGTLSGTVFSVLSQGDAAKAWSGVSGSANALQSALDNSFSTSLMLKESLYIAVAVASAEKEMRGKENLSPNAVAWAALSLPNQCRLAKYIALSDANRAVSGNGDSSDAGIKVLTDDEKFMDILKGRQVQVGGGTADDKK